MSSDDEDKKIQKKIKGSLKKKKNLNQIEN